MKIEINLTTFYSLGDERRFFQGLKDIDCISNISGVHRSIIFDLNINRCSKEKIFDLMAVLWRYGIDITPLRVLAERPKFSWMSEKQWYWHSKLFQKTTKVMD